MIKLILLMAMGKKFKNPNRIFYLVKSYLILYMLAFPITNFAQSFDREKSYLLDYNKYNIDMENYLGSVDNFGDVFFDGKFMFHEYYASAAFGDLNIINYNPDGTEAFTY